MTSNRGRMVSCLLAGTLSLALTAVAGCDAGQAGPDEATTAVLEASPRTKAHTGVARWTLHGPMRDRITVGGLDESGTPMSTIEIRSGASALTVKVDAIVVPVTVGPHPLPARTRALLAAAADDLGAAGGSDPCRAAVVTTIAASAACGSQDGDALGCVTAPFHFCAAARACGSDACDR